MEHTLGLASDLTSALFQGEVDTYDFDEWLVLVFPLRLAAFSVRDHVVPAVDCVVSLVGRTTLLAES